VLSPTNIAVDRPNRLLTIDWPDGRIDSIPFATVRRDCPCAACVSELTGERLLDPASIPDNVELDAAELAGNYALRIRWSDRHDTGLFTWEHLRRLGDAASTEGNP
jgi:DUF971 family protein